MIPKPIFKILTFPLWFFFTITFFWLWFLTAPEPQGYYLGIRSGFEYERLLLPAFPAFPGSKPQPEHHNVLAVRCGNGFCLATPATYAAKQPAFVIRQQSPASVVQAELGEHVYGGSVMHSFWLPVWLCPLLLPVLFIAAAVLDYKRRNRILRGVQVAGRWPTAPESFSGFFSRFRKSSFRFSVEKQ